LETLEWHRKREILRALVRRVEIGLDQVQVVFRVDAFAGEADPEKKSLQLCKGSTDPTLWCSCVCWREEAHFDYSCFQPVAQRGGEYWQLGQQWFVVNIVKGLDTLLPLSTTHSMTPWRS